MNAFRNELEALDVPTSNDREYEDQRIRQEELADALHARARLEELFSNVPGNQKVFMDTMELCREPQTPEQLDSFMGEILVANRSVYSPVDLRTAMQNHGALEYVPSVDEQAAHQRLGVDGRIDESEPVEVDEDGFLVIRVPQPGTWVITATARDYLDEDPLALYAQDLLEVREPQYLAAYTLILKRLAESSAPRKDLAALVEHLPECQEPRMYVGHFLGELEHADAITWTGADWQLTTRGSKLLERLQEKGE